MKNVKIIPEVRPGEKTEYIWFFKYFRPQKNKMAALILLCINSLHFNNLIITVVFENTISWADKMIYFQAVYQKF